MSATATKAHLASKPAETTGCMLDESRSVDLGSPHLVISNEGIECVLVPGHGEPGHMAHLAVEAVTDCGLNLDGCDAIVHPARWVILLPCDNSHHAFHPVSVTAGHPDARLVTAVSFE
jgi:hypothetical protein